MKKKLLFLCVMFLMFALTGCKPNEEKTLQEYVDKIVVETEVENDFYLLRNIDNKEDHTISWESSDAKTIKIGNLADVDGKQCYTAKVTRSNEDKTVTLKAIVEMESGLSKEKKFNVVVKGDPDKPIFNEWPYEENKAYKFTLKHTNPAINKDFYFTGKMAGFYLATSEYSGDGVDVYCEKAEGGYKLYFTVNGVKNYLAIEKSKDGAHTNAVFGANKNCVFTWNPDYQTMVTKIDALDAYFGTDASKTFTTIGVRTGLKIEENCVVTLTTPEIVPNPTPTPDPKPQPEDPNWGILKTFEAGKAYKFGLLQVNDGNQVIYINGLSKDGFPWFLATTTEKAAAADVTAVQVEGGYNLKVESSNGTKYINAKKDGTHYSIFLEDTAATAWRWDETHYTFVGTCEDKDVFIGTHDQYSTLSANTMDKMATSMPAHFYGKTDGTDPKPNPDPEPTPQPSGEWPYEAGKAYKMTLVHTNSAVNKTFYFTGAMAGFYFGTSENAAEGVDVFCEKVEGGYKLYFTVDGVKNYIGIVVKTGEDGRTHTNAVFGADVDSVFNWDATLNTMVTVIDGKVSYFGTKADGTYTTIGGSQNSTVGAQCVVTLTNPAVDPNPEPTPDPEPTPQPEVKGNLLTIENIGVPSQTYQDGTATVNGIEYAYTEVGNYGRGIQMRTKNGKTTSIENKKAFAKDIVEIKFVIKDTKAGHSDENALKIEVLDETGAVIDTVYLNTIANQTDYTVTLNKPGKFIRMTHNMTYGLFFQSIEFVEAK